MPLSPWDTSGYMSVRKSIEWVEMKALFFTVCGPKFTKFRMRVGEWLQFSTPFSDRRYLVPVRRYSRSNRKIRNFDVLGPQIFLGEGLPKFLTQFKKLQSPPNTWQSLVTVGPETSEIDGEKSMIEAQCYCGGKYRHRKTRKRTKVAASAFIPFARWQNWP